MIRFRPTDPILGPPRGNPDDAYAYAERNGAARLEEVGRYVGTLWDKAPDVGIDPAVPFGQWCDETGVGDPRETNWPKFLNPAGIRIVKRGMTSPFRWENGRQAALGHLHRLCLYAKGDAPDEWERYDPFPETVGYAGYLGVARTIEDLAGRWATNPLYADQICDHLNRVGFKKEVRMPKIVARKPETIVIDPMDWAAPNRPAIPMPDPSFVTVHEVGNLSPGANEKMHFDFVRNGGGANSVSFHFVVGPTGIWQILFLNENAWHGSDGFSGRGNRDSIAIETIQIGDFDKTLGHLAWLIAELYRNPRRFAVRGDVGFVDDLNPAAVMDRTKQHNFWAPDKKNCPQFIRERGRWEDLLAAVRAELALPGKPDYKPGIVPPFWDEEWMESGEDGEHDGVVYRGVKRSLRIVKGKKVPCYRNGLNPKLGQTRPPITDPKEKIIVRAVYRDKTRKRSRWAITKYGSHIRMSNLTPYLSVG